MDSLSRCLLSILFCLHFSWSAVRIFSDLASQQFSVIGIKSSSTLLVDSSPHISRKLKASVHNIHGLPISITGQTVAPPVLPYVASSDTWIFALGVADMTDSFRFQEAL